MVAPEQWTGKRKSAVIKISIELVFQEMTTEIYAGFQLSGTTKDFKLANFVFFFESLT